MTDSYFMQQALAEARKAAEAGEVPVGAVIVCEGRIIARGHNLTERLSDVTAHAEIIALTAASEYLGSKYLDECVLYVTHITQGSNVTYKMHSSKYLLPKYVAAAVNAMISA